jgi:HPt (histidine-containing phosphotransfer) domain-containing protein
MIGADKVALQEFVKLFLETSAETMDELNSSFDSKDYGQVGAMAHKLKSSIDLMGIESLKTDIRTIERIGKDQDDIESLNDLIPKLSSTLKQVYIQMEHELD